MDSTAIVAVVLYLAGMGTEWGSVRFVMELHPTFALHPTQRRLMTMSRMLLWPLLGLRAWFLILTPGQHRT